MQNREPDQDVFKDHTHRDGSMNNLEDVISEIESSWTVQTWRHAPMQTTTTATKSSKNRHL